MKFGTMPDKAILSIFRVDAKLENSVYGGHLEFQNVRPWKLHIPNAAGNLVCLPLHLNPLYTGGPFHCYTLDDPMFQFRGIGSMLLLIYYFF